MKRKTNDRTHTHTHTHQDTHTCYKPISCPTQYVGQKCKTAQMDIFLKISQRKEEEKHLVCKNSRKEKKKKKKKKRNILYVKDL